MAVTIHDMNAEVNKLKSERMVSCIFVDIYIQHFELLITFLRTSMTFEDFVFSVENRFWFISGAIRRIMETMNHNCQSKNATCLSNESCLVLVFVGSCLCCCHRLLDVPPISWSVETALNEWCAYSITDCYLCFGGHYYTCIFNYYELRFWKWYLVANWFVIVFLSFPLELLTFCSIWVFYSFT